ncbi:GTPase IMAP family member 7-like [Pagrus major]|uniref:GTPase IMAP family member 7-like n=1 Tax=Pagrus major TaxID=143350 RepID=UPI003CC8D649
MDAATRRIVVLGKTGAGKSSLANTIFGQTVFKTDDSPESGTSKCQAETRSVNGRIITWIDTPGFFDTRECEEDMKAEIVRCITESAPGPHVFLLVLKIEKFTKQEQDVIKKMQQYFSEKAFKYATVLFTHGDDLREGQKIEEFVDQSEHVRDLVKKCGGRCHVIDNRYWKEKLKHEYRSNQFQVEELLKTIDKMTEANKGGYYTNEMLQASEKKIQEEERKLSSADMSKEAIRQQAKIVFAAHVLKVSRPCFTSGAMLGLFLGEKVWNETTALGLGVAMGAARGADASVQ